MWQGIGTVMEDRLRSPQSCSCPHYFGRVIFGLFVQKELAASARQELCSELNSYANTLRGKELMETAAWPAGLQHPSLCRLHVSLPIDCQHWESTNRSRILQTDVDLTQNKLYTLSGDSVQMCSCVY